MTQLDVARQIETCSFISNYVARTSIITLNNIAASLSDTRSFRARLVGEKVANLRADEGLSDRLSRLPAVHRHRHLHLEHPAGDGHAGHLSQIRIDHQLGGTKMELAELVGDFGGRGEEELLHEEPLFATL